MKRDLQRLELGPYSNRPFKQIVLDIGRFSKAGLLSGGRKISQRFTATEDGLKAVGITLETPNGMQTMGTIEWDVTEIGENQPLASGKLDVNRINGGETVRLRLPYLGASKGREYQLTLSAIADDAHGLGVSLYTPVAGHTEILTIHEESGSSKTESLLMALRIEYAK